MLLINKSYKKFQELLFTIFLKKFYRKNDLY